MMGEETTALANAPGADVEILEHYKEAMRLLQFAITRVIATPDDADLANDDLSLISKLKKAMESKRKEKLAPLLAEAEAIRATYTLLMTPVLDADTITRGKVLAYQKEQAAKRQEEERINALRQEAARAEQALKGEVTEPVELIELSQAPTTVGTDMGTTGQRANWKWEVTDFSLVPNEYKVIDGPQLTAIARGHHDQKPIPGVRFYNEPTLAVNAR